MNAQATHGARSVARHRSLYLQDEVALARTVQRIVSLLHDRHSLFGEQWCPHACVVCRAGGAWVTRGGYSPGFNAPRLEQIVAGARREVPDTLRLVLRAG